MAIRYGDDFAGRGLDPQAVRTLHFHKKGRDQHLQDIKKKQAEREMHALQARLAVIDREIQRLTLAQRRQIGEQRREQEGVAKQAQDVVHVSKALADEVKQFEQIREKLGHEKTLIARLQRIAGKKTVVDEVQRTLQVLRNKVARVESEIQQAEARRSRVLAELTQIDRSLQTLHAEHDRIAKEVLNKQHDTSTSGEEIARSIKELEEHQGVLDSLLSEQAQHDSRIRQLQARLSREEREAHAESEQLQHVQNRIRGAESGLPSLMHTKQQMEQKIHELQEILKQ